MWVELPAGESRILIPGSSKSYSSLSGRSKFIITGSLTCTVVARWLDRMDGLASFVGQWEEPRCGQEEQGQHRHEKHCQECRYQNTKTWKHLLHASWLKLRSKLSWTMDGQWRDPEGQNNCQSVILCLCAAGMGWFMLWSTLLPALPPILGLFESTPCGCEASSGLWVGSGMPWTYAVEVWWFSLQYPTAACYSSWVNPLTGHAGMRFLYTS